MSDQEEISVSVKLDLEDYISFNKAYMRFRLPWRIPFYIIFCTGLFIYALYNGWAYRYQTSDFLSVLAAPIALPIILLIMNFIVVKNKVKKAFDSDTTLRKEHVYTFNKEGLKVKSPVSEANYFWDDVFELRESKEFFFVFVAINKAFIIPKKDLYDKKIIEQFKGIFVSNIRDQKKLKFL